MSTRTTTPENNDTIIEERNVFLVSPKHTNNNLNPTRKTGRFLKPSSTFNDKNVKPFSLNPINMSCLNVSFNGWKTSQKGWKSWVDTMHSLHKSTWQKTGIYNAVLNSCFDVPKNEHLVLKLAEKWCHETNTFVFKWGEVSITLEDMMVLGGFSVLGDSVVSTLQETEETKNVLDKLNEARGELMRSKAHKVEQGRWMKKFKDSGSEIEHEAFLVLWLSRFVFTSSGHVKRNLTTIAVRLARGVKLALAPAVLASIYRDLSLLKRKLENSDGETLVIVRAPFQLVQLWIWERFPKVRPVLEDSYRARFARQEKRKFHKENVRSIVDFGLQDFFWQPYGAKANDYLGFRNLYQENGRWVAVGDCLDEELESWARCLRVSELVGLERRCIEQYLPHRVAMQFGMNQDIPGDVTRANANHEIAWEFYTRPIKDVKMYFPSRFSEPYCTTRYLAWLNETSVACSLGSPVDVNETEDYSKDDSRTVGSHESACGHGNDEVNTLGLELEARIEKVEEVFAYLKAKTMVTC